MSFQCNYIHLTDVSDCIECDDVCLFHPLSFSLRDGCSAFQPFHTQTRFLYRATHTLHLFFSAPPQPISHHHLHHHHHNHNHNYHPHCIIFIGCYTNPSSFLASHQSFIMIKRVLSSAEQKSAAYVIVHCAKRWLAALYEKSDGNWRWNAQLLETPRPL